MTTIALRAGMCCHLLRTESRINYLPSHSISVVARSLRKPRDLNILAMKAFIRGASTTRQFTRPAPETEIGLARTCPVMVPNEAAPLDGTLLPLLNCQMKERAVKKVGSSPQL